MDARNMTPTQLRKLADQKEQESKVVKVGTLKSDLYEMDSEYGYDYGVVHFVIPDKFKNNWHYTYEEKEELIESFIQQIRDRFTKSLDKDDEFVCYIINGQESWYCGEIENANAEWAVRHLENIRDIRSLHEA